MIKSMGIRAIFHAARSTKLTKFALGFSWKDTFLWIKRNLCDFFKMKYEKKVLWNALKKNTVRIISP